MLRKIRWARQVAPAVAKNEQKVFI